MIANILIAIGFFGTGFLTGLALGAYTISKKDSKKSETKKFGETTVIFVYDE